MTIDKPRGRPPTPPDKRRRRNLPASYGLAEPVKAGNAGKQPELGFEPHPMVARMWKSLADSVESMFFSTADWDRATWEMFYANELFSGRLKWTPVAWGQVQRGLNELLVSPADKRRAGIELKAAAADPDDVAAVDMIAGYQDKLAG